MTEETVAEFEGERDEVDLRANVVEDRFAESIEHAEE